MKAKKNKKLQVAIISLTSCEGCQFVMLDQGKSFLDWLKEIKLAEFRLLEDEVETAEHYDLCLVEGNPVTKENIELLKKMRKISDRLVAVGNCAALGGVWELKNYHGKKETIRQIYQKTKVENPTIKEVDNFVKVDFTIPGCPINGQDFMETVYQLLTKKTLAVVNEPVCADCQRRGYRCLLQAGEVCLGPITLAGCRAVCLKSKQACWGCRGLFRDAQVKNFMDHLLKNFPRGEVYRVMEVFGCRDSILKEWGRDSKKNKK